MEDSPIQRLPSEILQRCLKLCYDPPVLRVPVYGVRPEGQAIDDFNQTLRCAALTSRQLYEAARNLHGTHAHWREPRNPTRCPDHLMGRIQVLALDAGLAPVGSESQPLALSGLRHLTICDPGGHLASIVCDHLVNLAVSGCTWRDVLASIKPTVRRIAAQVAFDPASINAHGTVFDNVVSLHLDLGLTELPSDCGRILVAFPMLRQFHFKEIYGSELQTLFGPETFSTLRQLKSVVMKAVLNDELALAGRMFNLPASVRALQFHGNSPPSLLLPRLATALAAMPTVSKLNNLYVAMPYEPATAQADDAHRSIASECSRRGIIYTMASASADPVAAMCDSCGQIDWDCQCG